MPNSGPTAPKRKFPRPKIKGRTIFLGTALISSLLLLLFFGFVYPPLREELAAQEIAAARLKTRTLAVADFSRRHPDLDRYSALLAARNRAASLLLPPEADAAADFFADLAERAKQDGVTIESLTEIAVPPSPSEEKAAEIPDAIALHHYDLIASGDYFSLLAFVRDLEQNGRLLSFFHWSLAPKSPHQTDLSLTAHLIAYSWREKN